MQAFYDNPMDKFATSLRIDAAIKGGCLVQGQSCWYDPTTGRGCAIGIIMRAGSASDCAIQFGVPAKLAILAGALFEVLPRDTAVSFPGLIIDAMPVGADLREVPLRFAYRLFDELGLIDDDLKGLEPSPLLLETIKTRHRANRIDYQGKERRERRYHLGCLIDCLVFFIGEHHGEDSEVRELAMISNGLDHWRMLGYQPADLVSVLSETIAGSQKLPKTKEWEGARSGSAKLVHCSALSATPKTPA